MTAEVKLVGLDFGTTTSSAVIATAQLIRNAVTAKTELSGLREIFRSERVFTPFLQGKLDEDALLRHVDDWLAAGKVHSPDVFGGGVLFTGLAAQQAPPSLVRDVRSRLQDALVARADEPNLESWLAFMGGCGSLSRTFPEVPIVNLDIGGGTSNLAMGLAGNVLRTGCLFVGARHIQVIPGGYQIRRLSSYAEELLAALRIAKGVGDCLHEAEVEAILDFYMELLSTAIEGRSVGELSRVARLHEVTPFALPLDFPQVTVTLTGGVGALVYSHLSGEPWPSTTLYGDLGIDLARKLVSSPWVENFRNFVPHTADRATLNGLLCHNTEVSGNTLFLPRPECLPLTDIPILGVLSTGSSVDDIQHLITLLEAARRGGCLWIKLLTDDTPAVRSLAQRFAAALRERRFPPAQPLVLLVRENVGKAFGNYVSEWGALRLNLVVVDEITVPRASYVRIGKLHKQVVPISFYGLHEQGDGYENVNAVS